MQINKREIDLPRGCKTSRLTDYPPRLLMFLQRKHNTSDLSSPIVQVAGLDIEFKLPIFCEEYDS